MKCKSQNAGIVATVVALVSTTMLGCNHQQTASMIDKQKAVEIATKEARTLGYQVGQLSVDVQKTGGVFIVSFLPPTNQLGGDVTIKIDATNGNVQQVLRGQ